MPGGVGPGAACDRAAVGPHRPQAPDHLGDALQAAALAGIAATHGFIAWATAAVALGVGTAMVYPTLLAAIGDVAHPAWRATAVGVYRLWRDASFAVGALLAGTVADLAGLAAATVQIAAATAASGLLVAVRMYETHHHATMSAA
jgi:MFS family permease